MGENLSSIRLPHVFHLPGLAETGPKSCVCPCRYLCCRSSLWHGLSRTLASMCPALPATRQILIDRTRRGPCSMNCQSVLSGLHSCLDRSRHVPVFECPCYPRCSCACTAAAFGSHRSQRDLRSDPAGLPALPVVRHDGFAWVSRPREMREKSSFSAHARDGRTRSHRLLEDLWPVCRAFWPKHLSL